MDLLIYKDFSTVSKKQWRKCEKLILRQKIHAQTDRKENSGQAACTKVYLGVFSPCEL